MLSSFPILNRRHFLTHMAGFSALMAVPGMSFVQRLKAAAPDLKKQNKSLIILWMSGGPPTIDFWDLKPGEDNGGPFKTTKTSAEGVEICEHLPTIASQFKHLVAIRSLVTNEGDHNRGTVLMNTGRPPSPLVQYPALGSVVSQQLTPKELDLPGFISVGGTGQRIGPGFLGMTYAPFTVQNPGQPPANMRPPASISQDSDMTERIRRRQRLFYSVEDNFNESLKLDKSGPTQAHSDIYGKAFSLVVSPRGKVFDLSNEKKSLIDEYGANNFGRGCLLARKLVEAGVTCVEVDMGGYDLHANTHQTLQTQRMPMVDKGMGTLVKDLVDRGMWKNTVIVWMGEFGRTPRINQNAGRDHWARCWSVVVGGGAIKGGQAYGSTDKNGTSVKDNPVGIKELFATLYQGLGLDPKTQIRDNLGRPLGIADDNAKAEAIKALF
jgi:hypothetical protein